MTFLRRVLLLGAIAAIALLSASLAAAAPQRAARPMGCGASDAQTMAATGITSTTATLHGRYNFSASLNPSYYDYGLTTSYGTHVVAASPAHGGSGAGTGVDDPLLITGLTPGTTYHFKYSFPSNGCNGANLTFTTLAATTTTPPPGSESSDLSLKGPSTQLDVTLGGTTTITFTAKHEVGAQALNASVSSSLPIGLSLVSVSSTGGSCSGSFSCDLGSLNAGDQVTITVVLKANVVGQLLLDASIGGRNPDPTTGNNRPRVIINVKAPLSTRTLTVTSSSRIEGAGFGAAGSKVRLVGTLSSDEPRCTGNVKVSVFQSTTLGGATDLAAGPLSFTSTTTGSFDTTFEERPGQFYTLSIAPTEQDVYRCSDATAYFSLAPRLVKRTIVGAATRDPLTPTAVRIAGTLVAATSLCATNLPLVISGGGLTRNVTVTTDAKGAFSADVKAALDFTSAPPYLVNAALATVSANTCLGIAGTIAAAPSPVERSITVTPVIRAPAGSPDGGFTVTGTVTSRSPDCVKGATVYLVRYPASGDPVKTDLVGKTNASGKVSLTVQDDRGSFALGLDRNAVASSLCSNATSGFRVPARTMLRAITATAVRDIFDVSRVNITGSLTGAGRPRVDNPECVPDSISIESRKVGSNGEWTFVSYVRTTTDTGLFGGSFLAPGGGSEWRAVANPSQQAPFVCTEAVGTFSLPAQPVPVDITFNVNLVAHGSTGSDYATNGALVQIDGVLTAPAASGASCVANADVQIDGFRANDPIGVSTGGLEPFVGGVLRTVSARFRVSGRVAVPSQASAIAEDTAKLIRLRVKARTGAGGAQCLAAVEDSPAFAAPQVTNITPDPTLKSGGDAQVKTTLRSYSGLCRNSGSVRLEQSTFAGGRSSGWATVATAVPDPNGDLDFRFRDDGSNYGTWRLAVDGQSSVLGQCLPATIEFRLPQPTYVKKLRPNGGIESDLISHVVAYGDKAIVQFKVSPYPATDAAQARCVTGQQLKVRTASLGDSIYGVYTLTLDDQGRAALTIPVAAHATRITAALSSTELGSGPGYCVAQDDLHEDILNGYLKIASPAPMTIASIGSASQLRVGSAVSGTVTSEESNCVRAEVILANKAGDAIAKGFTDKGGTFSIAVTQVFASGTFSQLIVKPFKAANDAVSCAGVSDQGLQWGTPKPAPPLPPAKTTAAVSFAIRPEPKGKDGLRPPATTAIVSVRVNGGPADLPCAYRANLSYRQAWNAPTASNKSAVASDVHDNIASTGRAPSIDTASFEVPLVDLESALYVKVTFPKGFEACLSPAIARVKLPAYDDGQLDPGNWEYKTYKEAVKNLPDFAEAHPKCSQGAFAYGVRIRNLAPRKGYADVCATLLDAGINIAQTLIVEGISTNPADIALNFFVPGLDDLKWDALAVIDGTNPDAFSELKGNALNELKNDATGGQFRG